MADNNWLLLTDVVGGVVRGVVGGVVGSVAVCVILILTTVIIAYVYWKRRKVSSFNTLYLYTYMKLAGWSYFHQIHAELLLSQKCVKSCSNSFLFQVLLLCRLVVAAVRLSIET